MNLTRCWTCAHRKDHLFSGHVFPREGSDWAPEHPSALLGTPPLLPLCLAEISILVTLQLMWSPNAMVQNGSKNGSKWLKMVENG